MCITKLNNFVKEEFDEKYSVYITEHSKKRWVVLTQLKHWVKNVT